MTVSHSAESAQPLHEYAYEERTMAFVLADKARRIPDRPFLHFDSRTWTYGDVDRLTNSYARGLAELGVGHGSTVAVMLPNCPEFLWTIWGLAKLGAIAVPLNTSARGDQLAYFLKQSGATLLCVDEGLLDRVVAPVESAPDVTALMVRWSAEARSVVQPGRIAGRVVVDLATLESHDGSALEGTTEVRPSDPHLLMYTSGTTGPSKGAICPQSQGLSVGQQMATYTEYRSSDVLYTCLPLFHGNAIWYTVYAALWAEASVALYARFSARAFWGEIRDSGATVFNALGAMANIIWQLPASPADREHQVRTCMLVPTSTSLVEGFLERYGIVVTSVYAMTENCAVTVYGPHDSRAKAASAGRVRDYMSVQVVDDVTGAVLPVGETGEICVRPNQPGIIMLGYHNMPEATLEATRDLWFRTGDRGHLDDEGYLFFSDRKKEAIRRRGENISAYEVETALCKHPAVHEAAAVPVPSDLSEDEVMAYVVRAEGTDPTFEELVAHCVESMAYFMVPRYWKFVDELPKTASQKVEKYKLKQAAADELDQLWDCEKAGIKVRRS